MHIHNLVMCATNACRLADDTLDTDIVHRTFSRYLSTTARDRDFNIKLRNEKESDEKKIK